MLNQYMITGDIQVKMNTYSLVICSYTSSVILEYICVTCCSCSPSQSHSVSCYYSGTTTPTVSRECQIKGDYFLVSLLSYDRN